MWRSVAVFCAVLAFAKGQNSTEVSQCINFPGELPINTHVEGCATPPCQLPQLQDVVVHLTFRAPYTVHTMTTYAVAYLSLGIITVPVNYPLEENAVTCNFLSNSYCPLIQGEVVQYTLRMFIESFFPVGTSVTIEFRVEDHNRTSILCLRVPVRIVDAVDGRAAKNATLVFDQQSISS